MVETLVNVPKQEERKFNLRLMGFETKEGKTEKELVQRFNTCDLGEGGGPNVNPGNLEYFQDNITISLHCEMDRAATLLSRRDCEKDNYNQCFKFVQVGMQR